jgi:hypothetical protein
MASQLQAKSVPVEKFLDAFFLAIAPYSRMMGDLLAFFESTRAFESSTGVMRVAFDFGRKIEGLQFDLTSFRIWVRHFEQVRDLRQSDEPAWNHDYLTQLCKIVEGAAAEAGDRTKIGADNAALTEWLLTYQEGTWPEKSLLPPDTPPGASRDALDLSWDLWLAVVAGSSSIGRTRAKLGAITWQSREPTDAALDHDPWVLRLLDSMDWAARMASSLYAIAASGDALQLLGDGLHKLINQMPRRPISLERRIARFEALLSLPLWKRRPDLYAAWIGARIAAEAGPFARVHSINGMLRYSFAGTHLATLRPAAGAPLFLWAELRSPLSSPKGRRRLRGIQPDYSVQREPITYPESSLLVVECKQYLKSSPKSFAAALTDYARGRPSAQVLLVNYGPADNSISDRIDVDVRERTFIIGDMRPGSQASLEQFSSLVQSALGLRAAPPQPNSGLQGREEDTSSAHSMGVEDTCSSSGALLGNSEPDSTESNIQIREIDLGIDDQSITEKLTKPVGRCILNWSVRPTDLDLYAWVQGRDGKWTEVSYRNLGSLYGPPWAQLDRDCREGTGPEILTISQPCVVRCAVHNYSAEVPISDSAAELSIEIGGTSAVIRCPSQGVGNWWNAIALDVPIHRLKVINRIQDGPPSDNI